MFVWRGRGRGRGRGRVPCWGVGSRGRVGRGARVGQHLRAAQHNRTAKSLAGEHDPRVRHALGGGHLHEHALQRRLGPRGSALALAQPGQRVLGVTEVVSAAWQERVDVKPGWRSGEQGLEHVDELRLEDVEGRLLVRHQHKTEARDRHVAEQPEVHAVSSCHSCRCCGRGGGPALLPLVAIVLVEELLEPIHLGIPSAVASAFQVAAGHADLHLRARYRTCLERPGTGATPAGPRACNNQRDEGAKHPITQPHAGHCRCRSANQGRTDAWPANTQLGCRIFHYRGNQLVSC